MNVKIQHNFSVVILQQLVSNLKGLNFYSYVYFNLPCTTNLTVNSTSICSVKQT